MRQDLSAVRKNEGRGSEAGERRIPFRPPSASRRHLCSTYGLEWFTAGSAEFPVDDPVEIGLHAIGITDRLVYPGVYPDGTAIRFESFELCSA